ncbi:MAG: hypothetical protein ACHREM_10775 [Polyangiales bacterium]
MKSLEVALVALVFNVIGCESDKIVPYIDPEPTEAGADTGVIGPVDTGVTPITDTGSVGPTDTGGTDSSGTDVGGDTGSVAASPLCDLNGRWLLSQHIVAEAIGQTQASHNWFYYEISQSGTAVTITKGLHCGYQVTHISALGADVDSHNDWPGFLTHDSDTGRTGTFTVSGSSCSFTLQKFYAVRGATVSYYKDPSTSMPGASAKAAGSTPGWEDWDGDGNPGITLNVSGVATGSLYVAQRDWTQYADSSGGIAQSSTKFKSALTWNSEQDVLGYSGSSLITQSSTPSSDASVHYGWFAKLSDGQATGSDSDICAAVRTLKDTLVPEANAN